MKLVSQHRDSQAFADARTLIDLMTQRDIDALVNASDDPAIHRIQGRLRCLAEIKRYLQG